ncbi:replication-associated recombination protein A [Marinicella sp. W31]|uniref:replication-associated recombination protein A n=1 Tax=Marinicella sp. W31 TaxID=3023713 RepID=UPI0037564811
MSTKPSYQPLAARMRPATLEQMVGQQHLLAPDKPVAKMVASGHVFSMIFWGPPGSGKTTLAKVISASADAQIIQLSAVLSGVKDIRDAVSKASAHGGQTVVFVDEIHRFNKSQQDAFLPHVESGLITLIGATTENPSFSLNNALLSRARVFVLKALTTEDLQTLLTQVLSDSERGLGGYALNLNETQQAQLIAVADGDARRLLGLLEMLADLVENGQVTEADIDMVTAGQARRFDKQGDIYYEQISALHKSVRSSNPDATLYWLARMLDGGCDPAFLGRRLLRMASEDIGNADPRAIALCLQAWQSYERLGSPEGELALAQAAVYLACCAKSNAVYTGFKMAQKDAVEKGSLPVPIHLRNAPTGLMKKLGYGADYQYDHDAEEGIAFSQTGFPEAMGEQLYYQPRDVGLEAKISEKLAYIRAKKAGAQDD